MKNFKIPSWIILWLTWLLTLILVSAVVWNSVLREHFEDKEIAKQCQEKILSVLKSPSTAQFSNFEKLSNWNMFYDVDAQNSYWAMIRETYLCKREQLWCNSEPELFLKSMDSSERERYVEDWHYCEIARESYQEWTISWDSVDLLCDKFVSSCEKLKNIEEKSEKNSKEMCDNAKKGVEEWLYTEEDLAVLCE